MDEHHRAGAAGWVRVRAALAIGTLALLTASGRAAAQQAAPEPPAISVVTFGRGDAVHQYFGHDAFVVGDPASAHASVINYGMFSFGPDMIPSFLRGRLRFWWLSLAMANPRFVRVVCDWTHEAPRRLQRLDTRRASKPILRGPTATRQGLRVL